MYTLEEISMCVGQEIITTSGACHTIHAIEEKDNLIRLRYGDKHGVTGYSWVTANLIVSIPWFDTFKHTKMCKVILS